MKSKRAREAEAAVPVEDVPSDDVPAKKRKRSDDDQKHDVKKSKKDKKDKKDKHKKESRRERKDKRRDLQDLPEQEEEEQQEQPEAAEKSVPMTGAGADSEQPDAAGEPNEKKAKKDKKKKERKDKESKEETKEEKKDKKDKKEKKDKKKEKKEKKAKAESNDTTATPNEDITTENAEDDETASKKKDRHIVFVGNLPFSATVASITAHFASLSPSSVRCLRNRDDPNPCRGIAFVEFAQVWHMRTCLDKFHHSLFDDGVSPARRINVELTAGGGGKTKQRTQKIREKNDKLNENRAKRIEREKTAKANPSAKVDAAPADGAHMEDAIHPSRRARVPANQY